MDWLIPVALFVFTILFGIIGFFLRSKDAQQEKQIFALWSKHDEDAKALSELKIQIASDHYVKRELDGKFDKLDTTFREGLKDLGDKFDRLSTALLEHK